MVKAVRMLSIPEREQRVKLNPERRTVNDTQVSYFGDIVIPDPAKIVALRDMRPPKDKAEPETILGMVNHSSKFAPMLSYINAPLHHLLKDSSELVWDKRAQ